MPVCRRDLIKSFRTCFPMAFPSTSKALTVCGIYLPKG
jgi:hypothetical protein